MTAPDPTAILALARAWPGMAIAIDRNGLIAAASPLSGYDDGMRAPVQLPHGQIASLVLKDAAGRDWRISGDVAGVRFAACEPRAELGDASTRFTASVSHEIRTPLNGILGMASLLEESGLQPPQAEYVSAIRKSGARLLDLLNNVLDYSRMEAGQLPLEYSAFSPSDLVQDVAELLSPRAHSAGLDLAAIVEPGLPETFMGDVGRLRQVLFNLAGNAIKFTEQGGVLIECRSGPRGEGLSLIVRDTGVGVPDHARAHLFEAFGQARADDARRDGGVGLGLAIVARLVDAMKGRVSFYSRHGEGALFRVDVPLYPAPKAPGSRSGAGPKSRRRPSLIALDLPPASLLACASTLEGEFRPVVGGEALLKADLVILDAARPPARIEAIARARPTLIVLRPEDRARLPSFLGLGCAGYLIRPLRPASVIDRVRHALAGDVQNDDAAIPAPGEAGHVLIADDNGVNALLASRALTAAGFRVDIVATGAEALERASQTAYSVIFMDIRMPVMDGLEATRRIRRLGGRALLTPIIALTADVDPDLETRARAAGINAIASKPIDPPRLRQLASHWSKRKSQAAE
jgi:signal transduction histidine kinase/CheY-like chemotaxis protein